MLKATVHSGLILKSKNEHTSTYESVVKEVEITKLKNTASRPGGCGYYGFCPKYKKEFPGEYIGEPDGWCHLIKSENKGLNLPVLKYGEVIDV